MNLTYPWFLLGLLGVGIPIIIHLLQLRRPQRLLFTNNAFIREVELVTVRHRKVQQLLTLLARIVAVAALVLVFCGPFVPAEENTTLSAETGADVLVDNSFSMQLKAGTKGSLFDGAVAEARNLGQNAPAGGRLKLLNSGRGLLTQPTYQTKLDGLKMTAINPFSLLEHNDFTQLSSKNSLYVFSDFQKDAFNAELLDKAAQGKQVLLVLQSGAPTGNVFVDSVWLDDVFVRARTNMGLRVRLKNGGGLPVIDCPVKVFLGERQVAAFRVTVAAGQVVTSVVQVQVSDKTLALGRVVVEDKPVIFDNTYCFTLQPAAAIQVLEIGAEPVAMQLYGNEPLFSYTFVKPQNVNFGVLRTVDLVLLHEVHQVDAGLREALQAVLKRGGSVVVVPSALPTARDSYQQLFRGLGLGTVQWEAQDGAPELREVAMPNAQEPFFRDVFGAQQRAVTMPRVAPVLRWARTGTDILRMRDGESYLAEFASGAGRVYVFSAPFASDYSDFTAHALFVPVMYRMAMLSYRNEQLPAYRLTQGTVALQLPVTAVALPGPADEAGFRLVKDSLILIPAQRVVGQDVRLELPAGMDSPGFYQVQRNGKLLTTLAFNQDKRESELAAYSADELRQLVGPNRPNVRVLEGGADGAGLAKLQAEQTGRPLWRYFLALALLALLTESFLVRFGNRRAERLKVKLAV